MNRSGSKKELICLGRTTFLFRTVKTTTFSLKSNQARLVRVIVINVVTLPHFACVLEMEINSFYSKRGVSDILSPYSRPDLTYHRGGLRTEKVLKSYTGMNLYPSNGYFHQFYFIITS